MPKDVQLPSTRRARQLLSSSVPSYRMLSKLPPTRRALRVEKKKKINTFREIHFLFTSVLEVDRIVDSATETAVGERGEDARCDVQLGDTACKGAGDVELGGVLAHGENLGDRVRGDRRGNHWNST